MIKRLLILLAICAACTDIRLGAAQSNETLTRLKGTPMLAAFPETDKKYGDNSGLFALGMIGLAVFGVALVAILLQVQEKRLRNLQALADSIGFTFHATPTADEKNLLAKTRMWKKGRGLGGSTSGISNILAAPATDDLLLRVFEFFYRANDEVGSTIHYTVARMDSPLLQLPTFILQPASLVTRAKKFVGLEGLGFPEHPTFGDAYHLAGEDEPALLRIFNPAIIHYSEEHPGLTIEAQDQCLIVYRQQRMKAELFSAFLDEAKDLLGLFVDAGRATSRRT
jgi:hypothetical protein